MFVDQTKIEVQAGKGGDGAVSFRREKYVPLGGPAGGDGGDGGSIIFVADEGLRTLMDFRFRRKFKAQPGENGMNKSRYGRGAKDTFLKVPIGTVVYDFDDNSLIGDLTENGQKLVVAQGGRGGRGNIHFANSRNSAPEISENGEPGQFRTLRLELKMIADVGLVGFPSVGKSTLLSVVTSAKPKIAEYHFTTLSPNLGMVQLPDGRDFSLADLPGLIEGASAGVGLGIQFLRHVERTKVLLHLVEMDPENGRDPFEDYEVVRKELQFYDEKVTTKPEIIVATKMDLPGADERLAEFQEKLGADHKIYAISSITHTGVQELMSLAADELAVVQANDLQTEQELSNNEVKEYKFEKSSEPEFEIIQTGEYTFEIKGEELEKMVAMTNLNYTDGYMRLARKLKTLGIDDALRDAGATNGDEISISDFKFDFVE